MKKGYTIIKIPTKPHIKAYIETQFGNNPVPLSYDNIIGSKLFDLLQHDTNERLSEYSERSYTTSFNLLLTRHLLCHRGNSFNETNIKNFNLFMDEYIKDRYCFIMDMYMAMNGNFINNYKTETKIIDGLPTIVKVQSKRGNFLPARNFARKVLGIPETLWSEETIKKIYDRRLKLIESGKRPIPKIVSMLNSDMLKTVNF